MIKGVNRKIIEIRNPDSLYFEKAVLYLRPNVTLLSEAASQKEARKFIDSLRSSESGSVPRRRRYFLLFMALAGVGALSFWLLR